MTEREALELAAEQYRKEGYAIVVCPGRAELPEALAGRDVDLLARKGQETVAVQVSDPSDSRWISPGNSCPMSRPRHPHDRTGRAGMEEPTPHLREGTDVCDQGPRYLFPRLYHHPAWMCIS